MSSRPFLLPGPGTLNDDLPVNNPAHSFKNDVDTNQIYKFVVDSITSLNIVKKQNGEFVGIVFKMKEESNVATSDTTSINIPGMQGVSNQNIRAYRVYIPEIHQPYLLPDDFYECSPSIALQYPKVPFISTELTTGDLVRVRFTDKENLKNPIGIKKESSQPLDLRNPSQKFPQFKKQELKMNEINSKVPQPTKPNKKIDDIEIYLGIPVPREIQPLLDFIGKKESKGLYDAMNQVSTFSEDKNKNGILDSGEDSNSDGILDGPKVYGSTFNSVDAIGVKLTSLTFGELARRQSVTISDPKKFYEVEKNRFHPERIFAAGKYQIIPRTLKNGPVKSLNIPDDALFNEINQESIGLWLLKQRKPAWNYIFGKSNNLEEAMHSLAREWASLPDPKANGKSSYSENTANKAGHTLGEFSRILKETRERVTKMTVLPTRFC